MEKNDLEKVEVGPKELFEAHPVRAVLAAIVFIIWALDVLSIKLVSLDIVGLLVSSCFCSIGMWLAYGPINLRRVKRHKEMKTTADYIIKNQKNSIGEADALYCVHCGGEIRKEWTHCPVCGHKKN